MLVTDVRQERSRTRITALEDATAESLEAIFRDIEAAARADLLAERIAPEDVRTLRHAGMRYRHQSYEVSVVAPPLASAADVALLARRFHEAHHRRYGHMAETEAVEIVNFAVTAIGALAKPSLTPLPPGDAAPAAAAAMRDVYFDAPAPERVPVYRRATLAPFMRLAGPAIVEEQTSTIVLYPGQSARVDDYLNIEIEAG